MIYKFVFISSSESNHDDVKFVHQKNKPIQAELLNFYSIMQLCILSSKMLEYKAFLQL